MITVGSAATVGVAPDAAEAARRKCGYVSCTFYLNRTETNDLKYAITAGGVVLAIPVPIAAASLGLNAVAIDVALNHNYCVKVKVQPAGGTGVNVSQGFYRCL